MVRCYAAALASTAPPASPAALRRMTADGDEVAAFFGTLLPAARAAKGAARLCDLRELLAAKVRRASG